MTNELVLRKWNLAAVPAIIETLGRRNARFAYEEFFKASD